MTAPSPVPGDGAILVVGDVRIDLRYRRVMRPEGQAELPQRMFDLLLVFLAEPGVLHTRDTLFERVWPGVVVEDSNLSQSVWMLRKALGEPRKHWIRTVSKRGYVFEPPTPVRAEPIPALQADTDERRREPATAQATDEVANPPISGKADDAPDMPVGDGAVPMPDAPPPARPRRRGDTIPAILPVLALVAMWALLLAAVLPSTPPRQTDAIAPVLPATREVVVLQADTGEADDATRAPVALLDAWLSWKLDLLPEVVRRDALPRSQGPGTRWVVVLSAEPIAGSPDGLLLRARIGQGGSGDRRDPPDLELIERGTHDGLSAAVDALSQRIVARLLPHRADARWPALSLPPDIARRHAAAFEARRERDWARARSEAEAVASAMPTFAPAHLALAELSLRHNRTRDALSHIGMARRGLAPLPADALRILDAQAALVDPRRQPEAARALADLSRTFPARADFALAHARLLLRSGDPRAAQALLQGTAIDWTLEPQERRIRRQLLLTEIVGTLGDLDTARTQAQQTLAQLARLGPGWALERGSVRMQLARVHHGQASQTPSPALFELAAGEFEAAGDTLGARYARYLADEARRGVAPGETPSMRVLREEARSAGNAAIETEMLRREAFKHYNAGSHGEYRRLLRDALEVANASGDTALQDALEFDLLNQDVLVGNHASAKARIARLSRGTHTDERVYWAAEFDAMLHLRGGDVASAQAALARAERRLTAQGRALPRTIAVRLACVRGDIDLVRGDVASARRRIDACRHAEEGYLRQWSQILAAQADLLEGDPAQARVHLAQIERAIDDMPRGTDHWIMVETVAALLARVREYDRAERLYGTALQRCEDAGYELLATGMRIGLAEIAMARGDRARSRAIADEARRQAPSDAWLLQRRLDTLDLIDSLHAGDPAQTRARWSQLHERARRHDDGVLLAELESLAREAGFDEAVGLRRDAASRALPGATLDWLSTDPSR
ncbi:winged helix-turn-helix domain-containing protein [Lysobacter brunescens]|uniref:Winged helix-turn-helix domain-containing protein n=1 Tax=Lysobacter brunescens TaxID=262323 RepID=A0ABW2YEC5_9GAMM